MSHEIRIRTLRALLDADGPLRHAALSSVRTGLVLAIGWFPATVGLFFLTFVPVGAFNVRFFTMLQSAVDDALLSRSPRS